MSDILNLTGYKLTFDDEFNTARISQTGTTTIWADIRPGSRLTANSDIGFGTSAFLDGGSGYSPFGISGGALTITATPKAQLSSAAQQDVGPGTWASGLISSQQSFSQEYGYFEMRAELPSGIGMWPAFWMGASSGAWPPELDGMEEYADNPITYAGTVHTVDANGQPTYVQNWAPTLPNLSAGFHTYGVLWTASTITFYFDGGVIGSQQTPADMNQKMYMMADLAVTQYEQGAMATTPQTMKIDYIRAFSSSPDAQAVNLQQVSSPDGVGTANLYGATAANSPQPATDTLVLHLSEDSYKGNANFTVTVDGHQIGGTREVSALHGSGVSEDFVLAGNWGSDAHQVSITFINDLYDGTPQTDRNLYIVGMSYDGTTAANASASLLGTGWASNVKVGGTSPIETGPKDKLVLHLSEDAWRGDAQFIVAIDGKQVTAPQTVTALQSTLQIQDFTYSGNFAAGSHVIAVTFINDAYGGTPQTDRNLYVNSIDFDSMHYVGRSLLGNGSITFTVSAAHS